jgi:hypothetical protein
MSQEPDERVIVAGHPAQAMLEAPAEARVDRAAVHAEWRITWIRLDAVEGVDACTAVREHVEQILNAYGQ